ncbi:hypothetical protein K2Q08_00985 [Patescibacteria group bacterium]|nr:hypothetical protein [Patescibacteria group bacterium]
MKKSYMLIAAFGWFLVGANLLGAALAIEDLTNLPRVNVAFYADALIHVALGAFLIWTYYKLKHAEEPGGALQKNQDHRLTIFRNWVMGIIIFFEIAGSIASWILNDYSAGLNLLNISSIFDLIANIVLFYFTVELLRGRNKLNHFFWTILIYGLVSAGLMVFRQHWYGALMALAFSGYFIYAIKAQLNSKNFKVAHYIILPLLLIALAASSPFDNGKIHDLTKQYDLLQQQIRDAATELNSSFINFSDDPNSIDAKNLQRSLEKYTQRMDMIAINNHELQAEYQKQIPSISQKKSLEKLRFDLQFIDIYRTQSDKMQKLINYSNNLNFQSLTQTQLETLNALEQEINADLDRITQLQFELANANLD